MSEKVVTDRRRALFLQLLATHPNIEAKGQTRPYTSHNGHKFSVFSSEGRFGIRLAQAERTAFLDKYDTTLLESDGKTMREYVAIPDELMEDTEELKHYLHRGFIYVKSMRPKLPKRFKRRRKVH